MSKILQEKYLHGEFKFGFELEAYVNPYQIPTDPNSSSWEEIDDLSEQDPDYYWNMGRVMEVIWDAEGIQEELEDLYKFEDVKKQASLCINKYFPEEADWIVNPSSGVCYDGSLGICGFEWPSPTMKFTPSAIAQCIHLLSNLHNEGIETDEKCGFHVHLSTPRMTLEEAKWIVMNIAMNDDYIHLLTVFEDIDYYGEFFGSYAKKDFLLDLRKAFESNDFEKLSNLLDNEKYRVLRIHPQGTLEWRGPREFIGVNRKAIKDFFIKLHSVVTMFIEIMEKQTIGDYSKENFLSMVSNPIVDFNKRKYSEANEKILIKLQENPLLLCKLKLPIRTIRSMLNIIIRNENKSLSGHDILKKAITECVVIHGREVPEDIIAVVLGHFGVPYEFKKNVIKHLNQPYPFEKVLKNLRLTYHHSNENWILGQVLEAIDCFDTTDLIDIINKYNGDISLFANLFVSYWKHVVKTPMPPKIKNTLTNKLTEKGIEFDRNSIP